VEYPFIRITGIDSTIRQNELNDCTVVALAMVLNARYDTTHAHLQRYGRVARQSCHVSKAYRAVGLDYTMNHSRMHLGTLLKSGKLPERCIVQMDGHVSAVINGELYDTFRQRSNKRVYGWWHHRGACTI
jgi:hypothetical protein